MKYSRLLIFFSALVLFAGGTASSAQVSGIKHVIIFGIDALTIDGVSKSRTPNLDYIIRNGAYSLHNRVVMPTMSAPNWASILMGAGPEQHSITSNEWDPKNPPFPPVVKDGELFPSVFSILKAQHPNAKATAIYDWDKFIETLPQNCLDLSRFTHSSAETIKLGFDDFVKNKPEIAFWYFVAVDDIGDSEGHGTAQYYKSVTEADSLLGLTLKMLKDSGLDKSTVILVVSDHGGIDVGHGGESIEEIQVPMFIYGPGVAHGMEITAPVNNMDIASTVAWILGLKQPDAWTGRPIDYVFSSRSEKDHLTKRDRIIKAPMIYPQGGLFNGRTDEITLISNTTGDCSIYYTTDGSQPDGKSSLYTQPFRLSSSCKLKAISLGRSGETSIVNSADFRIVDGNKGSNGISYSYYEGDFQSLPDFTKLTPVRTGIVDEISLDSIPHGTGSFAVKFSGKLNIEKEGEYRFYCSSDDGSRLSIDGKQIMASDFVHRLYTRWGAIMLTKGLHTIEAEYFNAGDASNLFVKYTGPGTEKQILQPVMLKMN